MAYGSIAADQITTSVSGYSLGAGNSSLMKNKIINGAMVIDQRNAGASVTPTNGQYTLDRWNANLSQASKYTVQQNAGSLTPVATTGFVNYLGVTSSSAYSVTSTDYFFLEQVVEGYNIADLGWGTASAKTVTLSFWVYSSLTGTFGGVLANSAQNRNYPYNYTISSANTWTQISVTIAGDTSGTWLTTNGEGIRLRFGLGVGSTKSGTAGSWSATQYFSCTGAVSVVGTSGATFYITGVQLEVGSSATGFEYRQYGQELALCQRYFEMSYDIGTAIGTATSVGSSGGDLPANSNGRFRSEFKVTKRATPTVTIYSNTGASGQIYVAGVGSTNGVVENQGMNRSQISRGSSIGGTNSVEVFCSWTSSAEL